MQRSKAAELLAEPKMHKRTEAKAPQRLKLDLILIGFSSIYAEDF